MGFLSTEPEDGVQVRGAEPTAPRAGDLAQRGARSFARGLTRVDLRPSGVWWVLEGNQRETPVSFFWGGVHWLFRLVFAGF